LAVARACSQAGRPEDSIMRSVGLLTLGFIIGAIFVIVILIKACQWVF
jgi:hypothetical protein